MPKNVTLSLHASQVVHQAGVYPGFCSIKRLGVFLLPLDGMLVNRRVTPSSEFDGTHLYTWVERGTVSVKCLAQDHEAVHRPGLESGPSDSESSTRTIRPPRQPRPKMKLWIKRKSI